MRSTREPEPGDAPPPTPPRIAEVAVNVPLLKLFHYEVPPHLAGSLELGHRVRIPFGKQRTTGICVGFPAEAQVSRLKPIEGILHPGCRFDGHLLELTRWISDYYQAGWGEVLEAALPPPVRSGKEERLVRRIEAARPPEALLEEGDRLGKKAPARARLLVFLARNPGPTDRTAVIGATQANAETLRWALREGWAAETSQRGPDISVADRGLGTLDALRGGAALELHPDQSRALEAILEALDAARFQALLLHGITGSGKTEVYLRAMREALARGKRALVLVPEISLTPQTVLRFRHGLPGEPMAVLHSMLTPTERAREWRRIQEGRARVVIGVRSSVFSPVQDLGLIVVDEEHDASYKQDSSPRYNARDVAVVRASRLGIPIILGSATPSLESLHNARQGRYRLLELPRRVTSNDLPVVQIVTLQGEYYRADGTGLVSQELDRLIRGRLRDREQVLLFLNRRGFSTFLHCTRCDHVLKCSDCDIALTYHKGQNALRCHYCGHQRPVSRDCPECDMPTIRRSGVGTERITAELARRYDEARIARLDRDTASSQGAIEQTLRRLGDGEIDILVGTQMIAKGHDFPGVTLVGIINADTGLHFPDFRAAERTFQLLCQVAGRAGRGQKPGRVVIQTFFPDHFAVKAAATSDYSAFARKELEFRKSLGYPPYGRIARVLLQGTEEEAVREEASCALEAIRGAGLGLACRALGPVPSPIARIQGKFRYQILLKSASTQALHEALRHLRTSRQRHGAVDRIIDVDPQSML